ncbi:drug/metabolite transporter (DMT)-like permease [Bacillus ectoiniformans]|uniref:DMT family transporter n=1 Tax=Bacillus ectoiniformans TaxID=1494429 RepID=UPI00195AD278|nr:DMT family transporter [Bacillus ectoiniformans]MBM7649198.1 drug/metabolite transporter (DMT)-like permease [Bacillus ectoiniformans]
MNAKSPYVLLILATIIWGGNFVVGRAVASDIPPVTLSLLRWCTAFVFFYPFVRKRLKADWPLVKKHWKIVFVMAATGVAGFNTLVYIALHYTTSINASLVNSSTPIIIFMLSFLFLKEELHQNQLIGAIISICGVFFILTQGSWTILTSLAFNAGDLMVVAAVVLWSVYSILVKNYSKQLPGYSVLWAAMLIGICFLLPLSLGELFVYGEDIHWSISSIGAIGYVGIFASVVAFTSWNKAVAEIGPNKAGIFLNFIPLFASIFAMIFVGEHLAWYQAAGGIFVVLGVYLSTKSPQAASASLEISEKS